jgi:uncharacterized membrane protein YphA (DoxX/SURF4 family)
VAIGWHFLYEGLYKIDTTRKGDRPFTAEPYLRDSTGPLAPYYRGLVPDVNSMAKLDPARLKASWAQEVDRLANHYHLDQKQREAAQAELKKSEDYADIWFEDRDNQEKRAKYFHELSEVVAVERNPQSLAYQRELAAKRRKDLNVDRKALIADLDARGQTLRDAVTALATPEQRESAGSFRPPMSQLDWVNLATMWGLVAMGVCLMGGLLTRLAALAGAVFLAQIYMSMPPWPGLPVNPTSTSHYLYINQNLIEMLACLALMCMPTGQWIGLDAVLFGRARRRRELEEREAEERTAAVREARSRPADTGPIPI